MTIEKLAPCSHSSQATHSIYVNLRREVGRGLQSPALPVRPEWFSFGILVLHTHTHNHTLNPSRLQLYSSLEIVCIYTITLIVQLKSAVNSIYIANSGC